MFLFEGAKIYPLQHLCKGYIHKENQTGYPKYAFNALL
ncbi:hypothetical protein FLA_2413 [Filimonas lacunae]|nr:hypothetical protein FLA_2413 [Filimonas lacunae]